MKLLTALLLLLLLASTIHGQVTTVTTGPLTLTHKAAWEQGNVTSAAQAQSFVPRFRVNGGAPIEVKGQTCVPSVPVVNNQFTCTVQLNQALVNALNVTGTHTVVLRVFDPVTMTESADSVPFNFQSPPGAPMGLRFTP